MKRKPKRRRDYKTEATLMRRALKAAIPFIGYQSAGVNDIKLAAYVAIRRRYFKVRT